MTIQSFLKEIGAGLRPALFSIQIPQILNETQGKYLVKSASTPQYTISKFEITKYGRSFPFPSNRVWADWSCTFMCDKKQDIYGKLYGWQNSVIDIETDEIDYSQTKDITILQHYSENERKDEVVRSYVLYNAFPIDIGAIGLEKENQDAICEFQVTFAYTHSDSI